MNPVKEPSQSCLLETMCFLGGAVYRGMQKSFLDKNKNPVETICLFDSSTTGSTLGLRISEMSASAVRACIAKSDAEFQRFATTVERRIFKSFSQPTQRTEEMCELSLVGL
jgi:hypothetical protein